MVEGEVVGQLCLWDQEVQDQLLAGYTCGPNGYTCDLCHHQRVTEDT